MEPMRAQETGRFKNAQETRAGLPASSSRRSGVPVWRIQRIRAQVLTKGVREARPRCARRLPGSRRRHCSVRAAGDLLASEAPLHSPSPMAAAAPRRRAEVSVSGPPRLPRPCLSCSPGPTFGPLAARGCPRRDEGGVRGGAEGPRGTAQGRLSGRMGGLRPSSASTSKGAGEARLCAGRFPALT